jgi:acetyl esterase/lipase
VLDLAYGLAPETDWRGMVADVHQTVEWLKTHAVEHQLNPARIILMGASAGGHLALLAAYTAPEAVSVRAVISYYGAADLEFFYRYSSQGFGESWLDDMGFGQMARTVTTELLRLYERHVDAVGRLRLDEVGVLVPAQMIANCLGGTPDDCPDVYREASPLTHVGPHCPPTLLINGAHDLVMKPAMSRRLQRALQQAGVPVVYVELPDTEHGLDLYAQRIAPAFQAATYDVERFLALMN